MSGKNRESTRVIAGRTIFLLKLEAFSAKVFVILFAATFICRDNEIVHPFIEFLYYMVSMSFF